jgi:hypothetical protein
VDDDDEYIGSSTSAKNISSSSPQTQNLHFKNLIGLKKKTYEKKIKLIKTKNKRFNFVDDDEDDDEEDDDDEDGNDKDNGDEEEDDSTSF